MHKNKGLKSGRLAKILTGELQKKVDCAVELLYYYLAPVWAHCDDAGDCGVKNR